MEMEEIVEKSAKNDMKRTFVPHECSRTRNVLLFVFSYIVLFKISNEDNDFIHFRVLTINASLGHQKVLMSSRTELWTFVIS